MVLNDLLRHPDIIAKLDTYCRIKDSSDYYIQRILRDETKAQYRISDAEFNELVKRYSLYENYRRT
jgi:hypothetical protein